MLAIALAGLGALAFLSVRRNERFEDYVKNLAAQPGIVVTSSGRKDGKFFVNGLRDPLAADPARMLASTSLDPRGVAAKLEGLPGARSSHRAREGANVPVGARVGDASR